MTALVLVSFAHPTAAKPFDLIAPTRIEISTRDTIGGGTWVRIVAREQAISALDLTSITVRHASNYPQVEARSEIHADPSSSIEPFQAAGQGNDLALMALLDSEERILRDGVRWSINFRWPHGYSRNVTISTVAKLGKHTATFDTVLVLRPSPTDPVQGRVIGAQRVRAGAEGRAGGLVDVIADLGGFPPAVELEANRHQLEDLRIPDLEQKLILSFIDSSISDVASSLKNLLNLPVHPDVSLHRKKISITTDPSSILEAMLLLAYKEGWAYEARGGELYVFPVGHPARARSLAPDE